MTDPPGSPPDLRRLIGVINDLAQKLEDNKTALAIADRRARWARVVAYVGIATGSVGIVYGIGAKGTADDIQASRREASTSGCVQANVSTERTRGALVAGVSVLSAPSPGRTAEDQAALDTFIKQYTDEVERVLPFRDCSDAGIARYINHPPADPAQK